MREISTHKVGDARADVVSADGAVVAGTANFQNGSSAFRWTEGTGPIELSEDGKAIWYVYGMSADGNVLIGGGQAGAVFWTPTLGTVSLSNYLRRKGVDCAGWDIMSAFAISPDGTAITGKMFRDSMIRAFLVTGLNVLGTCAADLNEDGQVNGSDFSIFAEAYDLMRCDDPEMAGGCPSDFNVDGVVDDRDFRFLLAAMDVGPCS